MRASGTGGFSLMEVLVSLGIFTIGLVAVSAVFPTAITIQRETVREVDGRRVAQNAKATILAITRTNTELADDDMPWGEISYFDDPDPLIAPIGSLKAYVSTDPAIRSTARNPNPLVPMIDLPEPSITLGLIFQYPGPSPLDAPAGSSFHRLMNLDTRSYPQNLHAANPADSAFRRNYYWYPLIQAKEAGTARKWFVYLIVMHRGGTQLPPEVRRSFTLKSTKGNRIEFSNNGLFNDPNNGGDANNDVDNDGLPDYIQPGDRILADDGRVHRVILADATGINVDSAVVGDPGSIYFAVAIDGVTNTIKTETRSPMVWIEESIPLSVNP